MPEVYAIIELSFAAKSAADAAASNAGGAVNALRSLYSGSGLYVSGGDPTDAIQALQTLAILELADK